MLRGYILELGNVIPSKGEQEVVDVWAGKDCEWHSEYWVRARSKADAVGFSASTDIVVDAALVNRLVGCLQGIMRIGEEVLMLFR